MRRDAEAAAVALAEATRLKYADLLAAEDELRRHLREVARALVAALEGPQATLSPTFALTASSAAEPDE